MFKPLIVHPISSPFRGQPCLRVWRIRCLRRRLRPWPWSGVLWLSSRAPRTLNSVEWCRMCRWCIWRQELWALWCFINRWCLVSSIDLYLPKFGRTRLHSGSVEFSFQMVPPFSVPHTPCFVCVGSEKKTCLIELHCLQCMQWVVASQGKWFQHVSTIPGNQKKSSRTVHAKTRGKSSWWFSQLSSGKTEATSRAPQSCSSFDMSDLLWQLPRQWDILVPYYLVDAFGGTSKRAVQFCWPMQVNPAKRPKR